MESSRPGRERWALIRRDGIEIVFVEVDGTFTSLPISRVRMSLGSSGSAVLFTIRIPPCEETEPG